MQVFCSELLTRHFFRANIRGEKMKGVGWKQIEFLKDGKYLFRKLASSAHQSLCTICQKTLSF